MQDNHRVTHVGGQPLTVSTMRNLSFTKNEMARAVLGKLIRDPNQTGNNGYQGQQGLASGVINRLSQTTADNIEDFSYIFQALPDVKIAMEIWTSCLLSPKDGVTESLVWAVEDNEEYSAELFGEMLNELRQYFEKEYKLFDVIKPAVENALFKTGAYPLVIIPESSIDAVINGKQAMSTESLIDNFYHGRQDGKLNPYSKGFLGSPVKNETVGLESIIDNPLLPGARKVYREVHDDLTVTDNVSILKFQRAVSAQQKQRAKAFINKEYGLESFGKVDLKYDKYEHQHAEVTDEFDEKEPHQIFNSRVKDKLIQKFYRKRGFTQQELVQIKDNQSGSRLSVGHPLVLSPISSAVIPVHVPGDPRDIIGAFIILDEFGNVVTTDNSKDLYREAKQDTKKSLDRGRKIIQQMATFTVGCIGKETDDDRSALNDLAKTYTSLIEEDLLNRLNNGLYGKNVKIAHVEEIYRIMFARALSAMKTQILYVPGELITYFAFDFNKYGIGKSLLADGRLLADFRAAIMYTDIYSTIRNNMGRQKLSINLDEDEIDQNKTIAIIKNEFMAANNFALPMANESPVSAINTLRESAVDVVVNGSSSAMPETSVDIEDATHERHTIDDETDEKLRHLHILSMDLTPTILDQSKDVEFAAQHLTSHLLLNKRVNAKQRVINEHLLYDHVRKVTVNDGNLIKRLSFIIKENRDLLTDEQRTLPNTLSIIEDFLACLTVKLPSPDAKKIEEQSSDLDAFSNFVDSYLEKCYPDALAQGLPEDIQDKYGDYKEIFKAMIIRNYCEEAGYLPTVGSFFDLENVEDNITASMKEFIEPMTKMQVDVTFALDHIRKVYESKQLSDVASDDDSDDFGGSDSSSDSSFDDSDSGDDGFGGDDFGGMDDMDSGFDDTEDSSGEEEPTDDREEDLGF